MDGLLLGNELPSNAFAAAVTEKADQGTSLVPVETIDRTVQSPLRILIGGRRQRIVNPGDPIVLLKCRQDGLLIDGRNLELFHDRATNSQLLPVRIPGWGTTERSFTVGAVQVPTQVENGKARSRLGFRSKQGLGVRSAVLGNDEASPFGKRQVGIGLERPAFGLVCRALAAVFGETL